MTPLSVVHWLQGCAGRADGCASCGSSGRERYEGLTEANARLLAASSIDLNEPATREEWIAKGPRIAILCPAGTTFDAAEALRLELVAKVPAGIIVDVQIAPAPPGTLSAEDEAGARLFVSERAERLAGAGACGTPGCYCQAPGGWPRDLRCADCRDEPEFEGATVRTSRCVCGPKETIDRACEEASAMVEALLDPPFASPRALSAWTTVPLAVALDALKDHTAIDVEGEPARSDDDPFPWGEPEQGTIVVTLPKYPDRVEMDPIDPDKPEGAR